MHLSHLNIRSEKDGAEKERTAVDLKLVNDNVHVSKLKGLFPTDTGYESIIQHFYLEDGNLKTADLGAIELATEGIGVKASVKSEFGKELEFEDGSKINKFKIVLGAGLRCELSCRLQVYPSAKQIADLSDMLNHGVTVAASWKRTAEEEREEQEQQRQLDLEKEQRAAGEAGDSTTVQ